MRASTNLQASENELLENILSSGGCHSYLRNVSSVTHDVGSVIISTNGKATPMGRNFGTLVVDKSVKKQLGHRSGSFAFKW